MYAILNGVRKKLTEEICSNSNFLLRNHTFKSIRFTMLLLKYYKSVQEWLRYNSSKIQYIFVQIAESDIFRYLCLNMPEN